MNLRFDPSIILLYIAASIERYLRCHTSGCTSPIPRNEGMPEGGTGNDLPMFQCTKHHPGNKGASQHWHPSTDCQENPVCHGMTFW
jgi:hypothetical protein